MPGSGKPSRTCCSGRRARGWRITYLGGDTPIETLADAASALCPDLVTVTAVAEDLLEASGEILDALGDELLVAVGGPAAHSAVWKGAGARPHR